MRDAIQDARRHAFFLVDNEIISEFGPHIGATGVAVYAALCRYAGDRGEAWPAIRTLAANLALSVRTVQYAIRKLEGAGLIRVTRRSTSKGGAASNLYTILPVPKAAPADASGDGVVQQVHQGGATGAPGVVQQVHPKKTQKKKTQEEGAARPRNPLMDQLAAMCYGSIESLKAKGMGAKLGAALRDLRAVTPDITPEDLAALETWWVESDFRGRKGERPQPHQVADAWLRMRTGRTAEPRPVIDSATGKITYQW